MIRVVSTQRVMTISHAEFLRSLNPLGRDYPYRIDEQGRQILLTEGERRIEIQLGEERSKRLGALTLPETTVDFRFHGFEAQDMERFFFRFDLCFRRGGG
jgi:hypothetical protein